MNRAFGKICMVAAAVAMVATAQAEIRKVATITSCPPGAKVWINGVYRGRTPVEIPYNWNWYYDFRLEKKGYQTQTFRERFHAPVKHWIPFDFFAEALPVKSEEPQWRTYTLVPEKEP